MSDHTTVTATAVMIGASPNLYLHFVTPGHHASFSVFLKPDSVTKFFSELKTAKLHYEHLCDALQTTFPSTNAQIPLDLESKD